MMRMRVVRITRVKRMGMGGGDPQVRVVHARG